MFKIHLDFGLDHVVTRLVHCEQLKLCKLGGLISLALLVLSCAVIHCALRDLPILNAFFVNKIMKNVSVI